MVAQTHAYVIDCEGLKQAIARNDGDLVLVDLRKTEHYERAHLPGAVHLEYAGLVASRPPVGGLLPDNATLSSLLSTLGLKTHSWVVAYDDEGGGRASRLLWTLDTLGHAGGISLLDGGFDAWSRANGAIETGRIEPVRSHYRAQALKSCAVDAQYILANLERTDFILLDTRTPEEFDGSNLRAARGGHIPGAVNFNWTDAMDDMKMLRPFDELRKRLRGAGVHEDKEVIAYCQTHHRSSHTFVVLRALGFERAKGYAGAWSEWGNLPDTPIER